jgi:hypothetical protein
MNNGNMETAKMLHRLANAIEEAETEDVNYIVKISSDITWPENCYLSVKKLLDVPGVEFSIKQFSENDNREEIIANSDQFLTLRDDIESVEFNIETDYLSIMAGLNGLSKSN